MCMSCDLDVKESWATLNERHGATWNAGCLRLERSCGGDSWINMCVQADLLSFFTSGITESSSHRETQDLSLDPSIVSISKGHFINCYKHIDLSCSMVYEKCNGQLTPMRTLDRFNFSECSHFFVFICAQIIASSWHVWDSTSSVRALFMFIVYCQEDLMTLMQRQSVIRFTVGRALDSTLNVAGVRWDQIAGAAFGAAPVNVNEPLTALKGQLWSVQVVLTKVPNAVTRSLTSSSVAYPVLSRICKIRT